MFRCRINECDSTISPIFKPDWLPYAVPYQTDQPKDCHKYAHRTNEMEQCTNISFDRSQEIKCDEYIFKDEQEHRIDREV